MNEAEDVGIFVNTAHEDRERADDRRDKEYARGSAYMNDNKNQADKEWTANLKHDLAEKRHIEDIYREVKDKVKAKKLVKEKDEDAEGKTKRTKKSKFSKAEK